VGGRDEVGGAALRRWALRFTQRYGDRLMERGIPGWPERFFGGHTWGHRPGLLLKGEAPGIDALLGEGIAPALGISMYSARRLRAALDGGRDRILGNEHGLLATAEGRILWFQARLVDRL
jgi:flavin-dependent dehydrogenase